VRAVLVDDPQLAVDDVGPLLNRPPRFPTVAAWPGSVDTFDKLAFLFSSNPFNFGIAALTIEEAAYLYAVAREAGPGRLAEIGRYKGGSSFLLAVAMDPGAELWSYDAHVKLTDVFSGEQLDDELRGALRRFGLDDRVHVVVGDSRVVEPPGPCRLVFVDGDHSYEGVRADFEHWRGFVAAGGHLLFHDAVAAGEIPTMRPGVARLVAEIERDHADVFVRRPAAGSLAHFVRST